MKKIIIILCVFLVLVSCQPQKGSLENDLIIHQINDSENTTIKNGYQTTEIIETKEETIKNQEEITQEQDQLEGEMETIIELQTNKGLMYLNLYTDKAPETAGNFKKLVEQGFYDNTKFHRVIKDFMIQAGDPQTKDDSKKNLWGTGGPGYKIKDETSALALKHTKKGLLSMANSGPNTGGSQFFITLAATPWLDGKHAIFGEVTQGIDVLEMIGNVATDPMDRPLEPIVIERAKVVGEKIK